MRYSRAYTLIELCVIAAIIAILCTLTYPSCVRYLQISRRSDAHASLLKLASLQEQYFLYHSKYASINELTDNSVDDALISENSFYKIKVDATDTSYLLTASAIGSQQFDYQCQSITFSNDGKKDSTAHQACW